MTTQLDLADIQGNILRPYGRQGFPNARYVFLHFQDAKLGRRFVDAIRLKVTTAVRWNSEASYPGKIVVPRPEVAWNIGFTWYGLYALDLPTTTLREFPSEFIDGMAKRADILGDRGLGDRQDEFMRRWDPIWLQSHNDPNLKVHALIQLNAPMNPDGTPVAALAAAMDALTKLAQDNKVTVLRGHGGDGTGGPYQEASAILASVDGELKPTAKEHFGFTDGFGDPVFEGQFPEDKKNLRAIGEGAIRPGPFKADRSWRPLATGEFLLGYPDEAQEIGPMPQPFGFTRNGTFMAYRKLHQNTGSFQSYLDRVAESYASMMGMPKEHARETIMAKMAGRWCDGVPVTQAPTYAEWQQFRKRHPIERKPGHRKRQENENLRPYVDFTYRQDPKGIKCPLSSHMRRANPRDMLDPTFDAEDPQSGNGSVLNNRRRILRRGLPYGRSDFENPRDEGEHGIIFMAVCASLFRQFEFVQQQWMNYGLDFNAGNDTCPVVGNHDEDAKFVIPGDPDKKQPPFFCDRLPQFVETRGGEYFFIPSMTALRMIGMGVVDPT
jgi:Dyp-type peroxidase family